MDRPQLRQHAEHLGDITEVKYGLDVADDSRGNDLAYQMSLPFRTKERK